MSSVTQPDPRRRSPWWVVVGAGTANAVGLPMYLATTGLFVLPIVEDTGFSRTTVTGAYSVAAVGMVIGLIIVSRLVDRYAARYILLPSFVLFAASMATIGVVPAVEAIYFIPCFFVGFFGGGTAIPATRVVVSWFDNNRALAVGIVTGIIGLGAALGPVLAGALIESVGWRQTYGYMALIAALVSVTMITLFVRGRAERHVRGRLVQETHVGDRDVSLELPGLTFAQALRTRQFWGIALGLGMVGVVIIGLQVHLVPMMTDRGLSNDSWAVSSAASSSTASTAPSSDRSSSSPPSPGCSSSSPPSPPPRWRSRSSASHSVSRVTCSPCSSPGTWACATSARSSARSRPCSSWEAPSGRCSSGWVTTSWGPTTRSSRS
jgi:MFS family permease